MRTWQKLNEDEKQAATEVATGKILTAVVEGTIRFNDKLNGDAVQASIDEAIERANKMRTPWFAGEYVYEVVGDFLRSIGQCDAQDAYYPDPGEQVIRLLMPA